MEIIVAPHSLYETKSGVIVGEIWVRIDEPAQFEFPEAGWTDFAVVILGWWLREAEALVAERATEANCLFMDGPFEFAVTRSGDLRFAERRAQGIVERATFRLPGAAQGLWRSLHGAAAEVLGVCDARGWSGRDVETLRQYLAKDRAV